MHSDVEVPFGRTFNHAIGEIFMQQKSKPIPLASVAKDKLNVFEINRDLTVLVFYDGDEIKVVREQCPHMGGPLGKGKFSACDHMLACPWHGYRFSTSSLTLIENPNEATWIVPLAKGEFDKYKTPPYKLTKVKFRIEDETILVDGAY